MCRGKGNGGGEGVPSGRNLMHTLTGVGNSFTEAEPFDVDQSVRRELGDQWRARVESRYDAKNYPG